MRHGSGVLLSGTTSMSQVLRAIPTRYKNILFRSKLEADWAISLDGYGIEWEYEPEGRYWGDVFYAPDFLLPRTQQWFEVKGDPLPADFAKWDALTKHWRPERTADWRYFLAGRLGNRLSDKIEVGEEGLAVPPLVIGLPKGQLYLPEMVADLAAHDGECDEEGFAYWPATYRSVVLLHAAGFISYDQDGPPLELFERDGLWMAWNGFPYRHGTPKLTGKLV